MVGIQLYVDADEVYEETRLTPRQLADQRAELLGALKGMRDIWVSVCRSRNWDEHHMYQFTKAIDAIAKCEAAQ